MDKILKSYITNDKYIWNASPGACDECMSLDNEIFDEVDIPEEPHPNCKCYVEKVEMLQPRKHYTDRKNNTEYHEILKQAAIYVYHGKNAKIPEGYFLEASVNNPRTGFYADVLVGEDDVIIAFRGTELFSRDTFNDIAMIRSRIPSQTRNAIDICDNVKKEYPNKEIVLTGHSLGGSLADIVGALNGELAVSFNAYGVRDLFNENTVIQEDNIVNYLNTQDPVTMVNGENHIGEIYSVPNIAKGVKGKHDAEGMGELSEREKIMTVEIKNIVDEKFNPHKILRNGVIHTADTFEKMEKLRNRIKQEIEEMELRRQIELRKFKHSKL